MATFGIEYPWRDGTYIMPVEAESADDAMARVKQAANLGKCFTPHGMQRAAVPFRWFVDLEIRIRNLFR